MSIRDTIKGNDRNDIRKVAEAGDDAVNAMLDLGNQLSGDIANLAGAGRADETVKGNADAIKKLQGLYVISFVGANVNDNPVNCTITPVTPDAVPAENDVIIAILHAVTTSGGTTVVEIPALVKTSESEGIVYKLVEESETVKVAQSKKADLSANTYYALVMRA